MARMNRILIVDDNAGFRVQARALLEAVRLEHGARLEAEAGVVVDDEDRVHTADRGMTGARGLQG